MKIDGINPVYHGSRARARDGQSQLSFGNSSRLTKELISKNLPQKRAIQAMTKLDWLKGEVGGILITAVGTGFVAPIFIGFNPMTKAPKDATPEQKEELENTKKYTAMRQPLSAALAIAFQVGARPFIDRFLEGVFYNKDISKHAAITHDLQEFESERVIEEKAKERLKAEGKEKPSLIKAIFDKTAGEKRDAYNKAFKLKKEIIQDEALPHLVDHLRDTGEIKVGERHLDSENVVKIIESTIDDYIEDATFLNKPEEKVSEYIDRAKVLMDNEANLKSLFGVEYTPAENGWITSFADKGFGKWANIVSSTDDPKKLKEAYTEAGKFIDKLVNSDNVSSDIKVLLREINELPADLRIDKVVRTFERIEKIKIMCGGEGKFSRDLYREVLQSRNNILSHIKTELISTKKSLVNGEPNSVKKMVGELVRICTGKFLENTANSPIRDERQLFDILTDTETFGETVNENKILKDIVKSYRKLTEKHYKSISQFTKIAVGAAITLPITCTVLNWIYPRFMDTFFPELAGAKKASTERKYAQNVNTEAAGGNK